MQNGGARAPTVATELCLAAELAGPSARCDHTLVEYAAHTRDNNDTFFISIPHRFCNVNYCLTL